MPFSPSTAENTNWICSALSIVILLARLVVSNSTPQVSRLSKWICIASIFVVTARLPVVYYLLLYGFTNKQVEGQNTASQGDSNNVRIATVLTLVARLLATTYLWLQITLLLRFYSRHLGHIHWVHRAIEVCWVAILATYVASVLAIFLECRPLNLYWRIHPTIHKCTRAYVQIFTQCILNVLLDLALLVIAFPMLVWNKFSLSQFLKVMVLVLLGTFCMIITAVKLAYVLGEHSSQSTRTFWASIQVLVSTFVANAPTTYGCLRLRLNRGKEGPVNGTALSRSRSRPQCLSVDPEVNDIDHVSFEVSRGNSSTSDMKPAVVHTEIV